MFLHQEGLQYFLKAPRLVAIRRISGGIEFHKLTLKAANLASSSANLSFDLVSWNGKLNNPILINAEVNFI